MRTKALMLPGCSMSCLLISPFEHWPQPRLLHTAFPTGRKTWGGVSLFSLCGSSSGALCTGLLGPVPPPVTRDTAQNWASRSSLLKMGRRAAGPEAGRTEALSPDRRQWQRAGTEGQVPALKRSRSPGTAWRAGWGVQAWSEDDVVLDPLGGWKKSLLRDGV